eukprot:TRINITY_DN3328_c0_g1_i10.p1 TRINITY_DN3328_c0_g1~~TRINITY_DN3328_c0_g1_i10.p1  ORF type:complete len:4822 (+),score=1153.45 TRINITY_DN3328_c0_g1_i10:606-14468(+)
MEVRFVVVFRPQTKEDYACDISFATEREVFVVPVRATGSRAALDFPDRIIFGRVPVRFASQKTVFVCNVGTRDGRFSLQAQEPFAISPSSGRLAKGDTIQFTISVTPQSVGDVDGALVILYESGEQVAVHMQASAVQVNIKLECHALAFSPTYVSLQQRRTVKLFNNAGIKANFAWKALPAAPDSDSDPPFTDEEFVIESASGLVWPSTCAEFLITFSPSIACRSISRTLYCEVSGVQNRLPLRLTAEAIGPKAAFSFDMLDVGDVYVYSVHVYQATIVNRGEITAPFALQQGNHPLSSRFKFTPSTGTLAVEQSQDISIEFVPDSIGPFLIPFVWDLRGADEPVTLSVKGNIMAPTCEFDCDELHFGVVSFAFPHTRTINLVNTSEVPMRFSLRVPSELAAHNAEEFTAEPSKGTLLPFGTVPITVSFTPMNLKKYDLRLVVDVDGVPDEVTSLPILAECFAPVLTLAKSSLAFGECFIGHPYQQQIRLENDSDLAGKYELIPQNANERDSCEYSADVPSGFVAGHNDKVVGINLTMHRLGPVSLPVFIRMVGSSQPPLEVSVTATGVGPAVAAERKDLNFGKVQLLTSVQKKLRLSNSSLIPANYRVEVKCKKPDTFSVSPESGTLQPSDSDCVTVTVTLDEDIAIAGELVFSVTDGNRVSVALLAKGVGSTVVCEGVEQGAAGKIEFGTVPTHQQCTKELMLSNKGKYTETVTWSNHIGSRKKAAEEEKPTYVTVEPRQASLEPGVQATFVISAMCGKPCDITEHLVCSAVHTKQPKLIMETDVTATFMNPLLEISPRILQFCWEYAPDVPASQLVQAIKFTNVCSFALSFSVRVTAPFALHYRIDGTAAPATVPLGIVPTAPPKQLVLQPQESASVEVWFNSQFRDDKRTTVVSGKAIVNYKDHPRTDEVTIAAQVHHPNLKFDTQTVNFGCTLNETDKRLYVTVNNPSKMAVDYSWIFDETQDQVLPLGKTIHQVFDILPIQSRIDPGETEKVEFAFSGVIDTTCHVRAVCLAKGGPEYRFEIFGESSSLHYKFDKKLIECGQLPYSSMCSKEIWLYNTGKVPFTFGVNLELVKFSRLSVHPNHGQLNGGDKQKFTLKFSPVTPEVIEEHFTIQVAYFDPDVICVTGEGVMHSIFIDLPHDDEEEYWRRILDAVRWLKSRKALSDDFDPRYKFATRFSGASAVAATPTASAAPSAVNSARSGESARGGDTESAAGMKLSTDIIAVNNEVERDIIYNLLQAPKPSDSTSRSTMLLSTYVLDFGEVVHGTSKSGSFTLSNSGILPVSFDISKQCMKDTGFTIDPPGVKRLPGFPINDSQVFNVTFTTLEKHLKCPKAQAEVPINVKEGPSYMLILRASVIVPDVILSSSQIDFGQVICDQCKIVTIQLANPHKIPCDWESKPFRTSKDAPFFEITPITGHLESLKHENVTLRFLPKAARKFYLQLPIRVASNPETHLITCKGVGVDLNVNFSPPALTFGPTLSRLECAVVVTATNPSEFPLEFVSLDFDEQYYAEEEAIKAGASAAVPAASAGSSPLRLAREISGERLIFPPRVPGQPRELLGAEPSTTAGLRAPLGPKDDTKTLVPPIDVTAAPEQQQPPPQPTRRQRAKSVEAAVVAEAQQPSSLPLQQPPQTLQHSVPTTPQVSSATASTPNLAATPSDGSLSRKGSRLLRSRKRDRFKKDGDDTKSPGMEVITAPPQVVMEPPLLTYLINTVFPAPLAKETTPSMEALAPILEPKKLLCVVVVGPPYLGKSTQSALLAKRYKCPVLTLGSVVDWCQRSPHCLSDLQNQITQALNPAVLQVPSESEVPQPQTEASAASTTAPPTSDSGVSARVAPATTSIAPVVTAAGPPPAVDAVSPHHEHTPRTLDTLPPQLLASALGARIAEQDCNTGFVLDGVTCTQEAMAGVLLCLKQLNPDVTHLICLKGDVVLSKARLEVRAAEEAAKIEGRLRQLKLMTEEEYEGLPEEERLKCEQLQREKKVRKAHLQKQEKTEVPIPEETSSSMSGTATLHKRHHSGSVAALSSPEGKRKDHDRERDKSKRRTEKEKAKRDKMSRRAKRDMKKTRAKSRSCEKEATQSVNGEPEDRSADDDTSDERADKATPASATTGEQLVAPAVAVVPADPVERAHLLFNDTYDHFISVLKLMFPEGRLVVAAVDASPDRDAVQSELAKFLPAVESPHQKNSQEEELPIPPPEIVEVFSKLKKIGKTTRPHCFSIRPLITEPSISSPQPFKHTEHPGRRRKKEKEKTDVESDKVASRWVLAPHASQQFQVVFSGEHGTVETVLSFAVVGTSKRVLLPCTGVCDVPYINEDPQQLFYSRARSPRGATTIVHNQYILKENVFEFGPLLIGKSRKEVLESDKSNAAKFKISNPSLFEISVNFCLKSTYSDVFFLDPPTMTLPKNECKDLTVWAIPSAVGTFEDMIVALVKDNPQPVAVRIRCSGVKPAVDIDKHSIIFDRLLLNRISTQPVTLKNVSTLPCNWKVVHPEALGDDLNVQPTEGQLEPFSTCTVNFTYKPVHADKIKKAVKIDISDIEGVFGVLQSDSIIISAESYCALVDLQFPKNSPGFLNFGLLKVGQEAVQTLAVKNKGKYNMSLVFATTMPKNFTVAPAEVTTLAPNEKPTSVQITFSSTKELHLAEDADVIKCIIQEPKTKEEISVIPIPVHAQVEYAKYSITPTSINFGPLVFGSSASRIFTISNIGQYDFRFAMSRITDLGTDVSPAVSRPPPRHPAGVTSLSTGTTAAASSPAVTPSPLVVGAPMLPPLRAVTALKSPNKKKKSPLSQATSLLPGAEGSKRDPLVLGNFGVYPFTGLVPKGSSAKITIDFNTESASASKNSIEVIGIDIFDRDPALHPEGIPFDLFGEVCIPRIETEDFQSIFEEQSVVKSLAFVNSLSRCAYAIQERMLVFRVVILGTVAQERVKIINPGKVPCQAVAVITPRNQGTPIIGSKHASVPDFPFEVEPKKMDIAPNEYQYLTITFKPTSMQTYSGFLDCHVETKADSDKKQQTLSFEVRGEATLPQISVEQPERNAKNCTYLLKFHQLLVNASETLPIVLYNDGTIPAPCYLDLPPQRGFELESFSMPVVVEPRSRKSIQVLFKPTECKRYGADLRLRVEYNSFSDTTIALYGEAYTADIIAEGANVGFENEVNFGECPVGQDKRLAVTLHNLCASPVRYSWPLSVQAFSFSPLCGYIPANGTAEVEACFHTLQPQQCFKSLVAACELHKVSEIPAEEFEKKVSFSTRESELQPLRTKVLKKQAQLAAGMSEPDTTADIVRLPDLELKLSGRCDYARYECDTTQVQFKPTLMFQTRVHSFHVKNASTTKFDFKWQIVTDDLEMLEKCPFSVTPESGIIEASGACLVTVKFSPLEAGQFDCVAFCNMPNLIQKQERLQIMLRGTSLRPLCHFELDPSDYLSAGRRNPELRGPSGTLGPLDPETRVIEIHSIGIKVKNVKRFYVVNPTTVDYEFAWTSLVPAQTNVSTQPDLFRCLTRRGLVKSGKKFQVAFEFTPQDLELRESFWTFSIPMHKVSVPFLILGVTEEPDVFLSKSHVNFGTLLINRTSTATVDLENSNPVPFSWYVDKSSMNQLEKALEIMPTSGTVDGNSKCTVTLSFKPLEEKKYNFNLLITVRRKSSKLTLNVKGEGYATSCSVSIDPSSTETKVIELSPTDVNYLQFGLVQVSDRCIRHISIRNTGKFPLDYKWDNQKSTVISISPELGSVNPDSVVHCDASFYPIKVSEETLKVVCKITNGPSFGLVLSGKGVKPLLSFSFLANDFGPTFIFRKGTQPKEVVLEIENRDTHDISFESAWENKPHLQVLITPTVLKPKAKALIPFTFYPKAAVKYREVVPFKINGLNTVNVEVTGEGVEVKVEVADESNYNITFGALRINQTATHTVRLVNDTKCAASVSLAESCAVVRKFCVTLQPEQLVMKPKQSVSIKVTFAPTSRIPYFSEPIIADCAGVKSPVFFVSGAGQGIVVKLESENEAFGAVVLGSFTKRRVTLKNTGDIATKFHWDTTKLAPNFTLSPVSGFLSPGVDAALKLTFRPMQVCTEIRVEGVPCHVEGMPQPLLLSLFGQCVSAPAETEVNTFKTALLTRQTKTVTVHNKSNLSWSIKPTLNSEYFSCGSVTPAKIPPGSSGSFDVVYAPTSMTRDQEEHRATVFFALPDGTALTYTLVGTCLPPLPAGTITRSTPAKAPLTIPLTVHNWAQQLQHFKVVVEFDPPKEPTTTLTGLDYIDLPPLLDREYKMNFFSYKEGITSAKVTFKNELTKDYIFFLLHLTATAAKPSDQVNLETPIRQPLRHTFHLENPLNSASVEFSLSSNSAYLSFPDTVTVPPLSDRPVEVVFMPLLLCSEVPARVTCTSEQLGSYHFDFLLKATPPAKEKTMYFKVTLGNRQTQTFRFLHCARSKADYSCTIDNPDFEVDKSISLAPVEQLGTEGAIEVTYEPSHEGDATAVLCVSSPVGGEYLCPLIGHCLPPKPQGPVVIRSGSSTAVPVRNVFPKATLFTFHVDNPQFTVKPTETTIAPKKQANVTIHYRGIGDRIERGDRTERGERPQPVGSPSPYGAAALAAPASITVTPSPSTLPTPTPTVNTATAKFTVSSPHASWVYYIRGVAV